MVRVAKHANVGNSSDDIFMSELGVQTSLNSGMPTPNPESLSLVHSLHAGEIVQRQCLGYVYDGRMMLHAPRDDHWEAPARIHGINQELSNDGCLSRMKLIPIRMVRKSEALLVHSEDHWEKIQMIAQMTDEQIVMSESFYDHLSLYVSSKTTQAAQLSCGGVIEAALAVARGELEKSFSIVRPPGHHAEPEEHMGFCFLNNVAVATRVVQLLTPIKRIMILDWYVSLILSTLIESEMKTKLRIRNSGMCTMVSPPFLGLFSYLVMAWQPISHSLQTYKGNGTQRAFLDDPNVLYVSLHRFDGGRFYPCGPFGGMDSCGEGAGEGTSVNIPWPVKGIGDAEYLPAFMKIDMPIAMEFAPDLVFISAGFDAADGDELGECIVTPAGYAHMTHMLSTLANGKLVAALEGGYNVGSIADSALAMTRVLLGDEPPELKPLVAGEIGTEIVWAVANHQSRYWKNLDPQSCEPQEEFASAEQTLSIPGDLMEKDTLVLFVHQFGDLRAELSGTLNCDVELEYSYLVLLSHLLDATKDIVGWVREEKLSYVEVNTHPRPMKSNHIHYKSELVRKLVIYLWDNYIQFSPGSKIAMPGHGSGCSAIMELVVARAWSVTNKVKAIVFVIGKENVPHLPTDEANLRMWFKTECFSNCSQSARSDKLREHYGQIVSGDEVKPVKLLSLILPDIKAYVGVPTSNQSAKPAMPLAGRPPFATDEPDSVYDNSPATHTRRLRQPNTQDNRPNSAYDVYDNYIDEKQARQSGYGDLGVDLLNGDMDDDSDDETIAYHGDIKKGSEEKLESPATFNKFPGVTIVAPKPGYAAPVGGLTMPEPVATPIGQQRIGQNDGRGPAPLNIPNRGAYSGTPVPSTPHPLQPPMTPITPAFARPPKKFEASSVKFESSSIMRGQGEEVPLSKRGQRGDEFWRRFSMVVKEDSGRKSTRSASFSPFPYRLSQAGVTDHVILDSSWLEKTQNGLTTMSRLVWIVALLLVIIIVGAIAFGVYISHNSKTTSGPKALGGSEDQGISLTLSDTTVAAMAASSTRVSPTLTVQKRWPIMPTAGSLFDIIEAGDSQPSPLPNVSTKHRRMRIRRSA
ncbi:hypothetical protein EW145_g4728 [Phellinidium pouzarii]|uniref:histone deacetylase n=1 Tax=Phellinidium pouzarii TaxID=167371 RepID=A0A4S4L2G8_9AGAM|nr:hypothetical protein EW145_g4728 [Phellinidium pouzarii]